MSLTLEEYTEKIDIVFEKLHSYIAKLDEKDSETASIFIQIAFLIQEGVQYYALSIDKLELEVYEYKAHLYRLLNYKEEKQNTVDPSGKKVPIKRGPRKKRFVDIEAIFKAKDLYAVRRKAHLNVFGIPHKKKILTVEKALKFMYVQFSKEAKQNGKKNNDTNNTNENYFWYTYDVDMECLPMSKYQLQIFNSVCNQQMCNQPICMRCSHTIKGMVLPAQWDVKEDEKDTDDKGILHDDDPNNQTGNAESILGALPLDHWHNTQIASDDEEVKEQVKEEDFDFDDMEKEECIRNFIISDNMNQFTEQQLDILSVKLTSPYPGTMKISLQFLAMIEKIKRNNKFAIGALAAVCSKTKMYKRSLNKKSAKKKAHDDGLHKGYRGTPITVARANNTGFYGFDKTDTSSSGSSDDSGSDADISHDRSADDVAADDVAHMDDDINNSQDFPLEGPGEVLPEGIEESYMQFDLPKSKLQAEHEANEKWKKTKEEIRKILEEENNKPQFDIVQNTQKIISKFPEKNVTLKFGNLIKNEPPYAIARNFVSVLCMANDKNVKITKVPDLKNDFEVTLLDPHLRKSRLKNMTSDPVNREQPANMQAASDAEHGLEDLNQLNAFETSLREDTEVRQPHNGNQNGLRIVTEDQDTANPADPDMDPSEPEERNGNKRMKRD